MNIIANRRIFYSLSGALILASIAAIIFWGLKFGIDFTGGSILELEFKGQRPSVDALTARTQDLNFGDIRFQPSGDRGVIIRMRHISETEHQELLNRLGNGNSQDPNRPELAPQITEKRFDTIGPTIGSELQRKSVVSIILVILLIVSYIAFAFRKVSLPVESWKYGVTTIVALLHDVIIPTGFFAVAGRFYGFEVDTLFVTAVLTILGFSVHDTIVVFDRVRENLKKSLGNTDFAALVNQSVNETFTRSINTSLTVVLALAAVYFFGGESTKVFSLTLIVGIIVGTYSSIFIASPLLVTWRQWKREA